MSSVRHHSHSSSQLFAMFATTTWVWSCGSGVASALTARAQACSITTASKPCVSCRNAPLGADAHAHGLGLEQHERRFDGRAVRGEQLAARVGVAEGECEADALGRAEREVPPAHALLLDLALDDPAALRVEDAARDERAARRPAQQITAEPGRGPR